MWSPVIVFMAVAGIFMYAVSSLCQKEHVQTYPPKDEIIGNGTKDSPLDISRTATMRERVAAYESWAIHYADKVTANLVQEKLEMIAAGLTAHIRVQGPVSIELCDKFYITTNCTTEIWTHLIEHYDDAIMTPLGFRNHVIGAAYDVVRRIDVAVIESDIGTEWNRKLVSFVESNDCTEYMFSGVVDLTV